jgi:hypothetical protein
VVIEPGAAVDDEHAGACTITAVPNEQATQFRVAVKIFDGLLFYPH